MRWRRRGTVGIIVSAIVAIIGLIYSTVIAPRWLHVIRLQVRLPGLPAAWDGVRISHLSDFHVGGLGVSNAMLRRARSTALAFEPDIVALTGDFYDSTARTLRTGIFECWPANSVVVGVIGNHDLHRGTDWLEKIVDQVSAGGVRLLRNEACPVPLRGSIAWIAGVDDPFSQRADMIAALCAVPSHEPALVCLAHSPEAINQLPCGRARLLLTGHTHGGQIRLLPSGRVPLISLLWRLFEDGERDEPPVHRGYHWIRGTALIISDGLGTSLIPVRFRTRPQVLLIELTRRQDDSTDSQDAHDKFRVLNPVPRGLRWLS